MSQYTPLEWLALADRELLLFAGFFFLLGALDEFAVDLAYAWLRLTGRTRTWRIDRQEPRARPLGGPAALLVPAWHEDGVIEQTLVHTLSAWPNRELSVYVGCYRNDPLTLEAVSRGADGDPRVRLVVHDRGIM